MVDLGEWWKESFGLPLPLGGNVVRKDLGKEIIQKIERLMRKSVEYALSHPEEALKYAREQCKGHKRRHRKTKKFVSMYVNERTIDYGEDGRRAVRLLLSLGYQRGL